MTELYRLDRDLIFKKDIKKDTQFLKQVRQSFGLVDNIIYIGKGPSTDVL